MTQIVGTVLVVLLVATLLAREAVVTGVLQAPDWARPRIDLSIAVLAAAFASVVTIHLVTL